MSFRAITKQEIMRMNNEQIDRLHKEIMRYMQTSLKTFLQGEATLEQLNAATREIRQLLKLIRKKTLQPKVYIARNSRLMVSNYD